MFFYISEIEPISKEIEINTDAVISCIISGISQAVDSVVWKDSSGTEVTGANYVAVSGTYDSLTNSQTTTLSVTASVNTEDKTYKCALNSTEWNVIGNETSVALDVICKF